MFSMRFSAHLDKTHHEPPHLFKDAGVIADSLTGIQNAINCFFVVNRIGFLGVLRGLKSIELEDHAVGSPLDIHPL
jgi:hypothetical protein